MLYGVRLRLVCLVGRFDIDTCILPGVRVMHMHWAATGPGGSYVCLGQVPILSNLRFKICRRGAPAKILKKFAVGPDFHQDLSNLRCGVVGGSGWVRVIRVRA